MSKKDDKDRVVPAGNLPARSRCELCSRQFVSTATGYWSWRMCNEYGLGLCLCVGCASWVESVPVEVALMHLRISFSADRPLIRPMVIDQALEPHSTAIMEQLKISLAKILQAGSTEVESGRDELADDILHAIGDRARADLAERVALAIIDDDAWRDRIALALKIRLERLRVACGVFDTKEEAHEKRVFKG